MVKFTLIWALKEFQVVTQCCLQETEYRAIWNVGEPAQEHLYIQRPCDLCCRYVTKDFYNIMEYKEALLQAKKRNQFIRRCK